MESKEERGCLLALAFGLIVASLTAWYFNYSGLKHSFLVFFVVLFFWVIFFRGVFLIKDWLTGNATFKLSWFDFLVFFVPAIALAGYSLSQIYPCYRDESGEGAAMWLFLLMLGIFGVGKFLESSDDC